MSEDIFIMGEDRTSSYVAFTLANSCMPTLIKMKPSSLVSFRKRYIDSRDNFFKALIREIGSFGCQYHVLCEGEKDICILIYDTVLLYEVLLRNIDNPLFLGKGYKPQGCRMEETLRRLEERYGRYQKNKNQELTRDFPHEIGIILGYPAADVEEYIKNNGENYILCGYWKVYRNAEEAVKLFSVFSGIRTDAIKLFFTGRPLSELKGVIDRA